MLRYTLLATFVFLICCPTGSAYAQWVEDPAGPQYGDPDDEANTSPDETDSDSVVSPLPPQLPGIATFWHLRRHKGVVFGIWVGFVRNRSYWMEEPRKMNGYCKRTYHWTGTGLPTPLTVLCDGSGMAGAHVQVENAYAYCLASSRVQGPGGMISGTSGGVGITAPPPDDPFDPDFDLFDIVFPPDEVQFRMKVPSAVSPYRR